MQYVFQESVYLVTLEHQPDHMSELVSLKFLWDSVVSLNRHQEAVPAFIWSPKLFRLDLDRKHTHTRLL